MDHKLDDFKKFVKENPFLISYIRRGEKTWQDFYEMYDLYGEEEEAWEKFLEREQENTSNRNAELKNNNGYWDDFVKMVRNVDVNKVQEGITSLQKTLGLFGDLFAGKASSTKQYNPRPLYRRFED